MIKNKKKKKCEFSFKTSLKNTVRSIESREKFSRKTRIRRALYEEYRIGWKHVRSEGRENLLWNHAVTNPAQQRITQLYPLLPLNPRWHGAQPVSPPIDGDNRDTQCRRDVPSTRPSSCREDERGILNSRREGGGGREGISQEEKHEGRRKRETLGNARCTNRILVFFVFLERFLEKLSLRVGSLLVLGRALRSNRVSRQRISMIFPNATQSGSFDRLAEGDRGRLPCGFTPRAIHTSWNNKIVDVAWKWRNLSYIYIRMRYRKGKRWLLNLAIFWNNLRLFQSETNENKWQRERDTSFPSLR